MNTTHEQIVKIVLPTLFHFQDDLLIHDKNVLENYNGDFLYGWRRSGTDILRVLPTFEDYKASYKQGITDKDLEKCLTEEIIWITSGRGERNNNFLLFKSGKLTKITAERADQLHKAHITNVISNYKAKQQEQNQVYSY